MYELDAELPEVFEALPAPGGGAQRADGALTRLAQEAYFSCFTLIESEREFYA